MDDVWIIILGLTAATFAIRLSGVLLGQRIPQVGAWAQALQALPGSLTVALVTMSLFSGGMQEWLAACIALAVAVATKSLPLTMLIGIISIWVLRL